MDMNNKAIYDLIIENLEEQASDNGVLTLEHGFKLPCYDKDRMSLDAGTEDGIMLYHTGIPEISKHDEKEIASAVRKASNGDYEDAENKFRKICRKNRALAFRDVMQRFTLEHRNELSASDTHGFGLYLMVNSADIECVKVGMILIELFEQDDTEKQIVRLLGLSDEYTLYSIFIMRHWNNGNYEIWNMADCVNGWGKIHAVNYIEPETKEIKRWFLTKAVSNDVSPAYSGITCYKKAKIEALLEKEKVTDEELNGILEITDALIHEGSVRGISEFEKPEELLMKVLLHAKEHLPLHVKAANAVNNISDWQESICDDDNADMENIIDEILCDPATRENVMNEAKQGRYLHLAKSIGLLY